MKINVNFSMFCDRFRELDRTEQFSYEGKQALFDYIEDLELDTGKEEDLDVIALCCDYTEYENLKEIKEAYSDIKTLDDLRDHTQVIEVDKYVDEDNGRLIIQNY